MPLCTCFTDNMCKVGIPVIAIDKYIEKLDKTGYGYVIYNYNKDKAELINEHYYNKIDKLRRNSKIASNSMAGVSGLCLGGSVFVGGLLPLAGGLALGSVAVSQFSKLGEFFIDKKRIDTVLPYEISGITDMIEKIT